jgi:hypothetical protein
MFSVLRRLPISAKLTGTVVASLIALCLMGMIAVLATRTIQSLGRELYVTSDRLSNVQMTLAIGIERAIGDYIRRLPNLTLPS